MLTPQPLLEQSLAEVPGLSRSVRSNPLLLNPFAAPTPPLPHLTLQVRFCYCKEDAKLQAACANLRSYLGQGGKGAPQ